MVPIAADTAIQANQADTPPIISVVVAVFNGMATLQRCIDSITGQTYPQRELIVIDGGSKDGTVELLESNRHRINYWISEPDRGVYHAWNKALKVIRGEWVYFLGADDYLRDELVLARVVPLLQGGAREARVVYGRVDLVRKDGSVIGTFGEPWNRRNFQQMMTIPHQGVFHHRTLFQGGGFNEAFRIAGDYELLLRELKSRDPLFLADTTIAAMQFGGMSSEGQRGVETLLEFKRAREVNGITAVSPRWRWALIKAHVRRYVYRVFGEEWARVATNWYRRLTFRSSV